MGSYCRYQLFLKDLGLSKEKDPSIKVCEPRLMQTQEAKKAKYFLNPSKYVQFKVSCKNCEVYKRFKDFDKFRELIQSKWPGIYIPPLPPKNLVKEFDQHYVENRRKQLEYFLIKLSNYDFIYDSLDFDIFLKQDKAYTKIQVMGQEPTTEQISLRLTQTFAHYEGDLTDTQRTKLTTFHNLLVKNQLDIHLYSSLAKQSQKLAKEYYQLSRQIMPEFQNIMLQKKEPLPELSCNFSGFVDLLDFFTNEQKEIQAQLVCTTHIRSLEQKKQKCESRLGSTGS